MIEKVRVHEIAKELGIASKDVILKATEIGIEVKSAQSVVTMEQADGLMNFIMNGESATPASPSTPKKAKSDTQKTESEIPVEEAKEIDTKVKEPEPVSKRKKRLLKLK